MILLSLLLLNVLTFQQSSDCEGRYARALPKAKTIVIAEVTELREPPGFWSGTVPAIQRVRYRVIRTLRGSLRQPEIVVSHFVVRNSQTADAADPKLAPELFTPGNHLLLFLNTEDGEFFSLDENCGAILANKQSSQLVERMIYKASLKKRRNRKG